MSLFDTAESVLNSFSLQSEARKLWDEPEIFSPGTTTPVPWVQIIKKYPGYPDSVKIYTPIIGNRRGCGLSFCMHQFPGCCGMVVAHDLEGSMTEAQIGFSIRLADSLAQNDRYKVILRSHVASYENSMCSQALQARVAQSLGYRLVPGADFTNRRTSNLVQLWRKEL